MQRIVIVSNRVPVPAKGRPQAGGLAVALRDIIGQGALWFGWSGHVAAETGKVVHHTVHNGVDYATVDLSKEAYKNFYVGFANSTLWPLLHFRLGLIEFRREQLEGYRAVNAQFAEILAKMLRPGDLVWVHDYHFIPMAAALRALGVTNRLGFFLHIPFVPSSVFGALPQGEHLLKDLCTYDVVGFQTGEHRHDFIDSVGRILHYPVNALGTVATPQHSVRSIVAPIGIDSAAFQKQAERSAKTKSTRRLLDSLADRKLLIGVDRLDYSKGIANHFEAFNRLLSRFSEFRQKVSFLQIAAPSREEVKTYASLRSALNRIAGDINGRHGTFDWVPLRYMSQELARSTLAGFYRSAHVGVVTPLRDGMNLVAHEYVSAQNVEDPGVLILSRFAGVASYFDDALLVNPYDPDEIAEAMNEALAMPVTERVRRHRRLLHRLSELTAEKYCSTFLKALTNTSRRLAVA